MGPRTGQIILTLRTAEPQDCTIPSNRCVSYKDYTFTQIPGEIFSSFFEGAKEFAESLSYFENHTYKGLHSQTQIDLAKEVPIAELTSLETWLKQNS